MLQKIGFVIFVFFITIFCTIFASSSVYFSLDPVASNLWKYDGIFYTKTGALSLSWSIDTSVSTIEFSGTTDSGEYIYATWDSLAAINAQFPNITSLTGGLFAISAYDASGALLGSEDLVVDKTIPKATSITYFDDNRNGKIDRLFVGTNEPIVGTVPTPYMDFLTIETRAGGLLSSCSFCDLSENITEAIVSASGLEVRLNEWDNIKSHLLINVNAGSSKSDLKFRDYTTSLLSDYAGNSLVMATSKFPNSSTGIIDGTNGIDVLDTGFLNGAYFSGALSVRRIDSRGKTGSLTLSGVSLTIAEDSYIGDGNSLKMSSGSQLNGTSQLILGSDSSILSPDGSEWFGKDGFSSAFHTLSGSVLSDVTTITESGIIYHYNGTIIGSWVVILVEYIDSGSVLSLYSGALFNTDTPIEIPGNLSWGNLRATVSKWFDVGEGVSFSGVTLVFDVLTQSSVAFVASIASTGSITEITKNSAKLSGVVFRPNIMGNMYYGTGDLSQSGSVDGWLFYFTGLSPDTTYIYRLGFVPFVSWQEILSDTYSFRTQSSPKYPPNINIAFQSTTYLLDQNPILDEFTCDSTHADCKINFDLSSSFSSELPASDFFCELDFDLDLESWEEGKCNPNTVIFPRGADYHLHFQIINLEDVSLKSDRSILIHVPLLDSGTIESTSGESTPANSVMPVAPIPLGGGSPYLPSFMIIDPTIVVQSGLDENNRCKKADCALNLEYQVRQSKEACVWSFPGGTYTEGTERKCNPGYVHYPFGEFTVKLRVYEQGNESNYREKMLMFTNGTLAEITIAHTVSVNHPPVANIKLQWTLGKTKKQSGKSLTCMGVDECSVNLSWEESYDLDWKKLTYRWNFGNGITSEKMNPEGIKYTRGNYLVTLHVTDTSGIYSEDTFIVLVEGKWKKPIIPPVLLDLNTVHLKIIGVSPNPYGSDGISEWIEIENPLDTNVSLYGCELDDVRGKGSSPYVFKEGTKMQARSKKRYYKLQTNISLNNTDDEANFVCWGAVVSKIGWNFSVPEGFVVTGGNGPYVGRLSTRVLRVVDGDTIVVEVYGKQEKVRLVGVDTPETVDPRKAIQYFGREASNFTKKSLEGKDIELEFDWNPRDKYGRLLAYVWIDGKNFDLELIRLGYARAYLRFPFKYSKEFEKIGKEAIKNKIGLWADPDVKKLLDAENRDDKAELEKQLKEDDKAILDDLVDLAKDPEIDAEKLTPKLLDVMMDIGDDLRKDISVPKKQAIIRAIKERKAVHDLVIILQWKLSKDKKLIGNRLTCRTKTKCSINLTAGTAIKNFVYFWDFGNGETFYGSNPKALSFWIGSHTIMLRVLNTVSWEMSESWFVAIVERLVVVKKPRKATVKKIPKEATYLVRPKSTDIHEVEIGWLSPMQASAAGVILSFVFLGWAGILARRRLPNFNI